MTKSKKPVLSCFPCCFLPGLPAKHERLFVGKYNFNFTPKVYQTDRQLEENERETDEIVSTMMITDIL